MGVPAESTKPARPVVAKRRGTHICVGRAPRRVTYIRTKPPPTPAMEYRRPVSAGGADVRLSPPSLVHRRDIPPVGTTPCGCPLSTIRAVPHRGRPAIPEPPLRKNKTAAPAFSRRGVAPVGEAPRGASHTYMRPAFRIGDDAARTTTGGCPYVTDETRITPNGAGRMSAWDAPLGASPT